jgi:hypothetical protein
MRKAGFGLAFWLAFCLTPCLAGAAPAAMTDAANGLYHAYERLASASGLPDAKARAHLEPFVSPALERALAAAATAQRQFLAANKAAPPLLEGDIFTSNFEGATAFKVGVCSTDAKAGHCTIALAYEEKGGAKALRWTDMLYLVKTEEGWRVDDIGYGGHWSFANQGRLRATLAMVTAMAR